jgi:predicted DCC family thiol-disulfide oxidoreductase YuxK
VSRVPILYDADCGLCRATLGLILLWDSRRRLRPVALQSGEADRLLEGMPQERRMASWHLVSPSEGVRSAGAAVPPLMRLLPGGRPVAWAAQRLPRASEWAYRFVADRRSAFGRLLPGALVRRASRLISERSGG